MNNKKNIKMRTAKNYQENSTGTYGFGYNQKAVKGVDNKIAIDNYGSVSVQEFNQRLAKAGRLDWSFFHTKKKQTIWSDEKLTEMINENADLFPAEF